MVTTEMNGGCTPCAIALKNKTLSFPTMDGLLGVDPANDSLVVQGKDIFIDAISADNKKINPDSISQIELPPSLGEITFAVGISAWNNKENIYLQYQLDDFQRRSGMSAVPSHGKSCVFAG
jgi:hypothetical protein